MPVNVEAAQEAQSCSQLRPIGAAGLAPVRHPMKHMENRVISKSIMVGGIPTLEAIVRILDGASVIVQDIDGTVKGWTAGCEDLYGWSREEALGKKVHELLDTVYSRPREEILNELLQRKTWRGQLRHRHKDGRILFIASRWAMSRTSTDEDVILQTNNDISDVSQAQSELASREAHLRSILDTIPDAMVVIDEAGIVTSFSTAAQRLFGYPAEAVCGRNVKILMPSPHHEKHDNYIRRYVETGERKIIGSGRVVEGLKADGTIFPMELAVGEATANGRRIFTGFIRDLTSRQKVEDELRQAQKMEAVGQLTGGVAHDFNNLLTVISGNLEMLESRIREPSLRVLLAEAQDAAESGAKLTEQLLAYGRRRAMNPKLTDLGRLVIEFSELLRRTLGGAIELRTVVTSSGTKALVDPSQLRNALLNLVLNARDAMPGSGRLTIEVGRSRIDAADASQASDIRPGEHVVVSIIDTGLGMSDEVQRRAFEPFFTTKGQVAGTGLGLSMVYGFVKQSGGHVELHSELGVGTTVRLLLPAIHVDETVSDGNPDAAAKKPLPRGNETILVVEDDARVRRVAVARLRDAGYLVLDAASGSDALACLAAHPEIRLLFTDIAMGGMRGDELAREARALRPDLKILFTSGYTDPNIAEQERSPETWLRKPHTARQLAQRVRTLLDRRP